jgi:hypothetical protein
LKPTSSFSTKSSFFFFLFGAFNMSFYLKFLEKYIYRKIKVRVRV